MASNIAEAKTRLAEEKTALERSEAYLAEAQRLTHCGSWHWNITNGEVLWSKQYFAIFALDPEKTRPSYALYLERIHPDDRSKLENSRELAIRRKENFEAEYRLLLPGQSIKYVHRMRRSSVGQSGDVEFNGAIIDVTERKRDEKAWERLRQAQADLAHINRVSTMGELTVSLAHEIKQPISAAVTDAKTCLRCLAAGQPDVTEAQEAASRLIKDVTRATEIVDRISSLFKKGVLKRELVDINEVMQEMIGLLSSEATRYSVSIYGDFANDLPRIMADRIQLQQVFMNLMLNAIEAMKDMGVPGRLTVKSRQIDDQILVSITDTGKAVSAGLSHISSNLDQGYEHWPPLCGGWA